MKPSETDVPDRIRHLVGAVESFVTSIPKLAIKDSQRQHEESTLRQTAGTGAALAGLMLEAQHSALLKVVGQTFFARGIADLLEVAAGRPERDANGPSLAVLARSAAEAAAIVAWLIDPDIDGSERSRRTLIYLFDDLNHQMALVGDGDEPTRTPKKSASFDDLDEVENKLVAVAREAGWEARARTVIDGSPSGPGLVRQDKDRLEKLRDLTELVRRTHVGNSTHYIALSAEAHTARFAVLAGRSKENQYSGFLPPSYALTVLAHSIANATTTLASWTGADNTELIQPLRDLSEVI